MNLKKVQIEYSVRREKIIKTGRWFSSPHSVDIEECLRGRVLKMQKLSKGRGTQLLLFTYDKNVSLFLSQNCDCYSDFTELVRIGDVIVICVDADAKGLMVADFYVAAIASVNPEDLNFFNHNTDVYSGDALHKRVCGSRSEIDGYRTMSTALEILHTTMRNEGFLQVLTPTIERYYRGGYARPFKSYSNYFREDIFLRVTAETYHKQLIIGGLERLYEIVLSFRNESASQTSRNGFNLVEVEAAYCDEEFMFSLLIGYLNAVCERLNMNLPNISSRQSVNQLLYEKTGKTIETIKELRDVKPYISLGDDAFGLSNYRIANLIFRRFIIPTCNGLNIIQDLKENYSPFVLKNKDEIFRWFIVWNGNKIAEVYRSETDASIIKSGIDDICRDTERPLYSYENYLHSQFSGMPPIATMSMGIERIIMILCGKDDLHKVFE